MGHTKYISQWGVWVKAGYDGGVVVPLPAGRKGPTIDNWQSKHFSLTTLRACAKSGMEMGLRTRSYPTLDVDCDNDAVTATVLHVLATMGYGDENTMRRTRENCAPGHETARCAIIFRLAGEPAAKQARKFELPSGETFKLEFLGDGQQVKVLGAHDTDTGGEFVVQGGVKKPSELAGLHGADEMEVILDQLQDAVEAEYGAKRVKLTSGKAARSTSGTRANPVPVNPAPVVGGTVSTGGVELSDVITDEARLRELVSQIPNTSKHFSEYDDVIPVASAIWGASGGADWGLEVWRDWANSGDYEGQNSDNWVEQRWRSFGSGGTDLGARALRNMAREYDSGDGAAARAAARDAFSELESSGSGSLAAAMSQQDVMVTAASETIMAMRNAPTKDEIVSDPFRSARSWPTAGDVAKLSQSKGLGAALFNMVYRVEDGTLYERATMVPQGGRGFQNAASVLKSRFGADPVLDYTVPAKNPNDPPVVRKKPLHEFLAEAKEIPRCDTFGYFPGGPEFYRDPVGRLTLNSWRATPWVKDAVLTGAAPAVALDATEFGKLSRALFESTGDADWQDQWSLFLDWCAVTVCYPAIKPGFHWFFTGGQGIGKSLIMEVLTQMVGSSEKSDVDADTLAAGWGDFLKAKLVTVDEFYLLATGNRDGHVTYNKMKKFLSRTPETLTLNIKTRAAEQAYNLSAWVMASNKSAAALKLDPDDRRFGIVDCSGLHGKLRKAALAACGEIGAEKDKGFRRPWLDEMARAFADRFHNVWSATSRLDAVLGLAPASTAKVELSEDNLSPVAAFIQQAWRDGLIPDVTHPAEVQSACMGRRTVPSGVMNALSAPYIVAQGLEELGAARGGRVRLPGSGQSTQYAERVRVFILPSAAVVHPLYDGVQRDVLAHRDAVREWQQTWANAGQNVVRDARDKAVARLEHRSNP